MTFPFVEEQSKLASDTSLGLDAAVGRKVGGLLVMGAGQPTPWRSHFMSSGTVFGNERGMSFVADGGVSANRRGELEWMEGGWVCSDHSPGLVCALWVRAGEGLAEMRRITSREKELL